MINKMYAPKNLILTALTAALTVLCAPAFSAEPLLNDTDSKLAAIDGTLQSVNGELSEQRARIGALAAELAVSSDEAAKFRSRVLEELKALRRQNQSMIDSLFSVGLSAGSTDASRVLDGVKPLRNYDRQAPDGKLFFGEDEYVYVKEANATFDARIDTGAAVSSISARDITEFERGGKKWYRFRIEANGRVLPVEAPFVRYSDVRQSSKEEVTRRPVVSLNVKVGSYSAASEFTLTDRTRMQYVLLIGRTLIQDIAVVDVSRDHVQGRSDPEGLIILMRDDYEKALKEGRNPNAAYDERQRSRAGEQATPAESNDFVSTDPQSALPAVVHEKRKAERQQ